MNETDFREFVSEELLPLLRASLMDGSEKSGSGDALALAEGPFKILIKPTREADYRLALTRRQQFSKEEVALVAAFVKELETLIHANTGIYEEDLLETIPRRVVSSVFGVTDVLQDVLRHFEEWSSETYEGQRIVFAIGIDSSPGRTSIPLESYWNEPFAPALTSGYDTFLIVGSDGNISRLGSPVKDDVKHTPPITAPYRLKGIAGWARGKRVSVVLNKHGEILIFKNHSLRFIQRNGKWFNYVHDTNIRRMGVLRDEALRKEIYASCLDVSFARTGGCIGVLTSGHHNEFNQMVDSSDRLETADSTKARILREIIAKRSFGELDRRLRNELLSIDGALILDEKGKILAVGAIVKSLRDSEGGGGRTAAAKALASLGMGIKISEDGSISGFRKKGNSHEVEQVIFA